jgi:hypothetical protein
MIYSNVPLWFGAYIHNFLSLSIVPISAITLIAAILSTSLAFSEKVKKNRTKYLSWAIVSFLVTICWPFTGEFLDEVDFRKACEENEGLRIHKKIILDSSFLIPYDPDADPKRKNFMYVYEGQGIQLDRVRFDKLYYIQKDDLDSRRPTGYRSLLISRETNEVMSVYTSNRREAYFMSQRGRSCYDLLSYPRHNREMRRVGLERKNQIKSTVEVN